MCNGAQRIINICFTKSRITANNAKQLIPHCTPIHKIYIYKSTQRRVFSRFRLEYTPYFFRKEVFYYENSFGYAGC